MREGVLMDGVSGISSPPWSARTKRIVAVILFVVVGVFAWRLDDLWPPLVISLVLAYLLSPIVAALDRRLPIARQELRRAISTTLAFILAIMVVVVTVLVLVPPIIQQLQQFGRGFPALLAQISDAIERVLSAQITIGGTTYVPLEIIRAQLGLAPDAPLNLETLIGDVNLGGILQSLLGPLASPVLGALGTAISVILMGLFVLTMTFFLMKDGPRFVERIEVLVPPSYRGDVHGLFQALGQVWNAYLRGQFILCVTMGVAGFSAATILGLPNPLVLGLINGILEFIPNLGPALALLPAGLFALFFPSTTIPGLQGVWFMLVVIVVWTGLQNLEAIFLVPRVMGDNLNLHPFVVILAVIGGASLAGALGVILAAPVVASLRVLGEYLYTKLFDRPPDWESRLLPQEPESASVPAPSTDTHEHPMQTVLPPEERTP